ncbi:MAG TPA: UvrD-helicase domain-containing protein [Solirubrobacteraceae bacterium]|nr:UvrD-helicase domain-containing protein [Solirubrobacteraceae bacterium]
MSALVDQSARERIETELDRNLGVEAAAGTGKTTVLVRRVVNLLATGKATVDQLVVITFTAKAAAELSTRVRDELERRAAATGEDQERELLHRAARDLHRAHIETIHSFATALLRERPVEAGIDPLFEVLEGVAAQLEFDRAYERFQDELLSEPKPELEAALRRGFGLAELREACEHLHEHRYLLPLAHPASEPDDVEGAIERLGQIAADLRAKLAEHQPGEDKLVLVIEGIIGWVERLIELEGHERERYLVFRSPAKTNKGVGSNVAWGGEKQLIKGLQDRYLEEVGEASARLRRNALLGLLPDIERFVREYAEKRKKDGKADFDGLLFWARDLLLESEPARRYFRERFRAVLIDEFQDTDPVQAELALLLTSDDHPGEDWRKLIPGRGRIMVVGDPKQSIYRFRRADIAVYEAVRGGALAGDDALIATNFRSNRELLRALNAIFDEVLKATPGLQPGNVQLQAPPEAAQAKRPPIVVAEGAFQGGADDTRAEEARVLAAMLSKLHSERWEVRERRSERWRACEWGDMAILVPTRTGIEYCEQALASAGIPYRHEGSRDFFQRDEVRDLIWVLSAIDDPTDRLALVGALRSSAFAISDDELVIHMSSARALSYRSKQRGDSQPVNDALAELADLHLLRRSVSLAELVRRVVERTRLVEFALTQDDGEQGAANLLAIVDDARLFAAGGGGGLRPFIRHLRDSLESEAIEIEATVAEETDDVVRIMTMHGAKGLEYPIVALANLGTQSSPSAGPVPREAERFLHFRVGADTLGRHGHFATPRYDEEWEAEKAYIQAEKLRLLYVAATRARDHLLIPCVVGKLGAKHLLGTLVRALPDDDQALVTVIPTDGLSPPEVESAEALEPTEAEIQAGIAERAAWIDAREQLKRRASKERDIEVASSRERAQGPLAAEVATFDAALVIGQGPPIPIGDAVHMVMERVALPDAADLQAVAEDVCFEGDIAADLDDVIAMCRACLRAPSVQRALAGGRYWREVPFVLSRDGGLDGDRGPLVSGRVDMVHRDGDELVVIDYKTDGDVTKDTVEQYALGHHAGQAEVYRQALAAATGLPVREAVFVYCKAGAEVQIRDGTVTGVAEVV